MGTSGSFGGGPPMVPSWVGDPPPAPASPPANPPPPDGQDGQDGAPGPNPGAPQPTAPPGSYPPIPAAQPGRGTYGPARSDMSSGARTSSAGRMRKGAGKFVAASGGGRAAARQMSSSRALAGGIASLAGAVASTGPVEALRRFNLEGLAGEPAENVFLALTDALCPPGGTIDEAIARDALLETVADLAGKGVGNFDELTQDDLQEVFVGVGVPGMGTGLEVKVLYGASW